MTTRDTTSAASLDLSSVLSGGKHFKELDSIRGLAALVVVFYHWTLLWPRDAYPRLLHLILFATPLQLLVNGHASVVVFFVLSGFVLSLPQVRGREVKYPGYLVKRICRIYLPYLFALIIAVAACWRFHGLDAYDNWFQRTWHKAPDGKMLLEHVLMIGNYPNDVYNTAFWSLVLEMRISLFFPALCWLILRMPAIGGASLAVALFVGEGIAERLGALPQIDLQTLACTGTFIVGILLASHLERLREWLSNANRRTYWAIFALCCGIFIYTPQAAYQMHVKIAGIDQITAVGAAGVILYVLVDRRMSRMVLGPIVSFLGRISYSLYLLHGTVLFLFAYIFYGNASPLVWFVPYLAISLTCAAIMYRWVELPSMNLGKLLAARFIREKASHSHPI